MGVPPIPGLDGGYLIMLMGGTPGNPHPDLGWGTPPSAERGTPPPLSRPGMEYPPSGSEMGYPLSGPGMGYPPPQQV